MMDIKKELYKFIESLEQRGMLTKSTNEFDYEWTIFDYLKEREQKANSEQSNCNISDVIVSVAFSFALYIRSNYNNSIIDAWVRNSDGKIFYNIDEVYSEFVRWDATER